MSSLLKPLIRSRSSALSIVTPSLSPSLTPALVPRARSFHSTAMSLNGKIKPAARVAGRRQDVW
jgi:hypothetical protein